MATDCNLRCKYCFAKGGNYNLTRKKMSIVTAKRSIDFLVKNSAKIRNLELGFFGDEPLMNFNVIKEVAHYTKEIEKKDHKKFSYNITTNGVLLNPKMMDFFVQYDFSFIFSLDGSKDVNDVFRIFPNGSDTYNIVLSNLKEFIKRFPNVKEKITIRGTFTSQTSDITRL